MRIQCSHWRSREYFQGSVCYFSDKALKPIQGELDKTLLIKSSLGSSLKYIRALTCISLLLSLTKGYKLMPRERRTKYKEFKRIKNVR